MNASTHTDTPNERAVAITLIAIGLLLLGVIFTAPNKPTPAPPAEPVREVPISVVVAPTKDSPSPSNVPADTKQDADGIDPVEPAAGAGVRETTDGGRRDEQRRNIAERVPSSADQSDWQPLTWDRYRDARLPALVYFSGKTCGPCHVFERGVLAPALPELGGKITLLRDDSFGASEIARAFQIGQVPTLFVVYETQQGKRMLRLVGRTIPKTPQDLLDVLQPYFLQGQKP